MYSLKRAIINDYLQQVAKEIILDFMCISFLLKRNATDKKYIFRTLFLFNSNLRDVNILLRLLE